MKSPVRIILLTLAVVAVLCYYVVMSVVPSEAVVDVRECNAVSVEVTDSLERQYVTPTMVLAYLDAVHLNPTGHTVDQIPLQLIEDTLTAHPLIATADCYMSAQGTAYIRVTQRVPLAEVRTASAHYFVATDRMTMPPDPAVRAAVLQVVGAVSEQQACGEVADFAEWLQSDAYWQPRVQLLRWRADVGAELYIKGDSARVILGDLSDCDKKMHRLETFFENGYRRLAHKSYSELDLRFDGQVVGR